MIDWKTGSGAIIDGADIEGVEISLTAP